MVNAVDLAVFDAINGVTDSWVGSIFLVFSNGWVGIGALVVILGWLCLKRRTMLIRGMLSIGLAIAFADGIGAHILKPWIGRVRPCFSLPAQSVHVLKNAANVGSMPSLHAANSFAVAFVVQVFAPLLTRINY